MGKKAVVTGGEGFIGSHIVDACIADGYETHVIDNQRFGRAPDRVHAEAKYHVLDLNETEAVCDVLRGADAVFHCAAIPRVPVSIEHPIETTTSNVTATVSLLEAASKAGVRRLIYSSSSSAYGDQTKLPLTEDMCPNPVNPYGLQKYAAERFVSMWPTFRTIETVSLRYFNVYGPRMALTGPATAIGNFLTSKKEGRPLVIFGDGTITRSFTHVRDVVRANMLALTSDKVGKGEVINIGSPDNVAIKHIAELVGGEISFGPPRIEAHDTQASIQRAKQLLGWEPTVKLEDGIEELKQMYL